MKVPGQPEAHKISTFVGPPNPQRKLWTGSEAGDLSLHNPLATKLSTSHVFWTDGVLQLIAHAFLYYRASGADANGYGIHVIYRASGPMLEIFPHASTGPTWPPYFPIIPQREKPRDKEKESSGQRTPPRNEIVRVRGPLSSRLLKKHPLVASRPAPRSFARE